MPHGAGPLSGEWPRPHGQDTGPLIHFVTESTDRQRIQRERSAMYTFPGICMGRNKDTG